MFFLFLVVLIFITPWDTVLDAHYMYVYICIPFEFDVDSGCDITLCGEVGYDFTNSGARLGDLK